MQHINVLVVEDEQMLNKVICAKLQEYGAQTVSARSVQQALEYIDLMPDISAIWMDHYLLGKDDGLVLVSKIKSDNSSKKHMPIFVVSNTASESKMRAYINLGVDKYVVKSNAKLDAIASDLCKLIGAKDDSTSNISTVQTDNNTNESSVTAQNVVEPVVSQPLPTSSAQQIAEPTTDSNTAQPQGQNQLIRVLITEDETSLRELLVNKFRETGRYEVFEAQDGEVALEVVTSHKIDAIVLDMEMPKLDGEGLLKKLNEHYSDNLPYVIVLTNTQSASKMANVLQYGALDYLIKADSPLSAVIDAVDKRVLNGKV